MPAETWSPSVSLFQRGLTKPSGDGWVQTGTKRVQTYSAPKNGPRYVTVPIYTRDQSAAAPATAAAQVPSRSFYDDLEKQKQDAIAAREAARNQAVAPFPGAGGGGGGGGGLTVQQLYQQILGRAPESQAAINYWNNAFGDSIDASEAAAFAKAAQPELLGRSNNVVKQAQQRPSAFETATSSAFETAASAALQALQIQLQEQQAAVQAQAAQQSQFLQQTLRAQQAQYDAQLEQSRQQQAALEAQAAEQRRQSEALQRAFVPNLEPTAAAPAIGDSRPIRRNAANNTLSTLAVLTGSDGSGPSSAASVLAGLQIA